MDEMNKRAIEAAKPPAEIVANKSSPYTAADLEREMAGASFQLFHSNAM